ncbi:hypothetical protein AGDE_13032 [Angomonas deanei]|nr:hypothetical protein AGDE_13032 [Angomonas deanei]|eukprot:EPY22848.1 hypothetical protein AGDE_13032 [Angomonas deanei]
MRGRKQGEQKGRRPRSPPEIRRTGPRGVWARSGCVVWLAPWGPRRRQGFRPGALAGLRGFGDSVAACVWRGRLLAPCQRGASFAGSGGPLRPRPAAFWGPPPFPRARSPLPRPGAAPRPKGSLAAAGSPPARSKPGRRPPLRLKIRGDPSALVTAGVSRFAGPRRGCWAGAFPSAAGLFRARTEGRVSPIRERRASSAHPIAIPVGGGAVWPSA